MSLVRYRRWLDADLRWHVQLDLSWWSVCAVIAFMFLPVTLTAVMP